MHHIKRPLGLGAGLPRNWLFLGLGYTAKALIAHLPDELNIVGTSRDPSSWPDALKSKVQGLSFKGQISGALKAALAQADVILVSLPPSAAGDPFLTAIDVDIIGLAPKAQWVGYLSATSVYGDRAGQWAFEDELLRPTITRGKNRVEAELAWLETGLPVHIFRLAGIYGGSYYGQSRHPFSRIKARKARAIIKRDHVVNRIHAEDIAAAILKSIQKPDPAQVYNLADGHPAPPQDVLRFAGRLLDVGVPLADLDAPNISDMARSFYSETKRISIDKARKHLGWEPVYHNYQVGLMHLYRDEYAPKDAVLLTGYLDNIKRDVAYDLKDPLQAHIDSSRAEPGCLRFDVSSCLSKRGRWHVVEIFKDAASYKAHQERTQGSEWRGLTRDIKRHYHVIGLPE